MQRQGSRYDRETKAQALAQAAVSTAAQAARDLQLPERTVRRWVERYTSENGREQWATDNPGVIARATELLHDAMDQIEERGEAYKHVMALNALRGTSIDKEQRQTGGGTVDIIALVTARAAELQHEIDGEYRLLDDGGDGNAPDDTAMVVSPPATREAKDGTSASETDDGTGR